MKIAIATDHAGLAYGNTFKDLKQFLEAKGHKVVDFGPKNLDMDDDYPDFIFPAAQAVASGDCERGIIMGGSGNGEAMAANRLKGVRCAVFYGPVVAQNAVNAEGQKSDNPYEIVKLSRDHNDANMLSLSGRFMSLDEMKRAIEVWLETPFSGAERHKRRIDKLDEA